ncbi:MAG: sigma-70 family RNA polymerase sigma factor [Anaerolineae bacterium]
MVGHLKQGRLRGLVGRAGPRARGAVDRETLAGIYEQFHEPIYSYVYRRVNDVEMASDLAAEVFHRLLRSVQQKGFPECEMRAWLYRTAHNLVVDHYRRQTHRQHLPLEEDLVDGGEDPAGLVEQKANADRVRRALRHLTDAQQQVIALKFLQGLTNQEVAEILDRSVGAIKLLQHRGLAALQRHLAADEEKVRT